MSKRFVLMVVAAALFLALIGALAGIEEDAGRQEEPGALGMPVPGPEDTPEMIVGDQEATGAVSNSMPVPGFEDVPEMIVVEE